MIVTEFASELEKQRFQRVLEQLPSSFTDPLTQTHCESDKQRSTQGGVTHTD